MASPAPSARTPRAVPLGHVALWYREGLALFVRAPARFMALAFVCAAVEVLLGFVPRAGVPLATMVLPLFAGGLVYASLAADRQQQVRLSFAILAFAQRTPVAGAVILAGVVVFAAQAVVAWTSGGADLLNPDPARPVAPPVALAAYAAGIAASLPVTFVPFLALLEGHGVAASFAGSAAALARNAAPLALYGAIAFLLAVAGYVTDGLALLVAVPLAATSSYAAWKDVFGVEASGPPTGGGAP